MIGKRTFIKQASLCLVAVLLSSCGGGTSSTSEPPVSPPPPVVVTPTNPAQVAFSTYYKAENQFVVEYPKQWERFTNPDEPEILITFSEPLQNATDLLRETLLIIEVDSVAETIDQDLSNLQVISTRQINVAGFPGEETIYDADLAGAEDYDLRFLQATFEFNGHAYSLIYLAERSQFDRNREIVRYMVSSLKMGQSVFENIEWSGHGEPGKPAIVSDGENFLVVSCNTQKEYPWDNALVGRIIASDRSMGNEFIIADNESINGRCDQANYTAAYDGNNFLVAYAGWQEQPAILAKRISVAGDVLDNSPILVHSVGIYDYVGNPTVISDDSRYLVVWNEFVASDDPAAGEQFIKGRFISPQGVAGEPFVVYSRETGENAPWDTLDLKLVKGENQFMLLWGVPYYRDTKSYIDHPIYVQILDLQGNIILSSPLLVRAGDDGSEPRYPQVSFDGSNYFVAWVEGELDTTSVDFGKFSIYGVNISSTGVASEPPRELVPSVVAKDLFGRDYDTPKNFLNVSFYDGRYLMVWTTFGYETNSGLMGAYVAPDLKTVSEPGLLVGMSEESPELGTALIEYPNIAYGDSARFIAWVASYGAVEVWRLEDMQLQ